MKPGYCLEAGEVHLWTLPSDIINGDCVLRSNCKRLDILSEKEPVQRRHSAKQRVTQLKYDCQHLQVSPSSPSSAVLLSSSLDSLLFCGFTLSLV